MTRRIALAASLALALCWASPGGAAGASHSDTACLDSSSPSFAVDKAIVAGLARYGESLQTFVFDGGTGVSERFFKYLSRTKCAFIMGFPVDLTNPDPPDGLALTDTYLNTAYVMVSPRKLVQGDLRPGMTVAVGMATVPHFYLAGAFGKAPAVTADTYQSQEQALDALDSGHASAAMVWEPSVVRYADAHPRARRWYVSPLHVQHARWKLAALYVADNVSGAAHFDAALRRLERSGGLAALTRAYYLEKSTR